MPKQQAAKSQLRIIGGKLRGSKIAVPSIDGLRPTPDRVRETLFNWLGSDCRGATVLDCFSGSGALGIEAASRGARWVTLIEQNREASQNLRRQVDRVSLQNVEVLTGDAVVLIPMLSRRYSVVFVDPPYANGDLRESVIDELIANQRLADDAQIYLEWPQGDSVELNHAGLDWRKHKKAGQVHYAIAEWRLSR